MSSEIDIWDSKALARELRKYGMNPDRPETGRPCPTVFQRAACIVEEKDKLQEQLDSKIQDRLEYLKEESLADDRISGVHGAGGCSYKTGDCANIVGIPGIKIAGQHDGDDDTVDAYGKPNGWCWSCWKSKQIADLEAIIEKLPRYEDTGKVIQEGDAVYEVIGGHRPSSPLATGVGCARMVIDDDFEERKLAGCFETREAVENALEVAERNQKNK